VKRLFELVLAVLIVNSIIFFTFTRYGKSELNQDERGWYVNFDGRPMFGIILNKVYIYNPENFSDILIPQNIEMEVFYIFSFKWAHWEPITDFRLIIRYKDFELIFTLTSLLVLTSFSIALTYIIVNRKNFLLVNKL
jgi:hypothetical protein